MFLLTATLVLICVPQLSFGDSCSSAEKQRLKEEHKQCTNTVQQRYSILTLDSDSYTESKIINTPMALTVSNVNSGLQKEYVCKMIEETVQGCASIYAHCFNEDEMR